VIVFSMVVSRLWHGTRYNCQHYLGAIIVIAGIVLGIQVRYGGNIHNGLSSLARTSRSQPVSHMPMGWCCIQKLSSITAKDNTSSQVLGVT
jgi:hypothetical protein